jgi:hypothetical protein
MSNRARSRSWTGASADAFAGSGAHARADSATLSRPSSRARAKPHSGARAHSRACAEPARSTTCAQCGCDVRLRLLRSLRHMQGLQPGGILHSFAGALRRRLWWEVVPHSSSGSRTHAHSGASAQPTRSTSLAQSRALACTRLRWDVRLRLFWRLRHVHGLQSGGILHSFAGAVRRRLRWEVVLCSAEV